MNKFELVWLFGVISSLIVICGMTIIMLRHLEFWLKQNQTRQVWFLGMVSPVLTVSIIYHLMKTAFEYNIGWSFLISFYLTSLILIAISITSLVYLYQWRYVNSIVGSRKSVKLTLKKAKTIKKIEKGLLYLMQKTEQNKEVEFLKLKRAAKVCTHELFGKTSMNNIPITDLIDVHLSVDTTVEYMVYLHKNQFFTEKKTNIANVISNSWPLQNGRGWGKSTLYNKINKLNENEYLDFGGITSEIALNNEMIG